jgi:hypothetical protein
VHSPVSPGRTSVARKKNRDASDAQPREIADIAYDRQLQTHVG